VRKFFVLLRKEVAELLTRQIVIPMLAMILLFAALGKVLSVQKRAPHPVEPLRVLDLDRSALSERSLGALRTAGFRLVQDRSADRAGALGASSRLTLPLLVIPEGFQDRIMESQRAEIELYAVFRGLNIRSLAAMGQVARSVQTVNADMSRFAIGRAAGGASADLLRSPVSGREFVVLGGVVENLPIAQVMGLVQSQTYLFPVLIFLAIMFSAQMVAMSIVSEKENKTLEILLSSPIDRRALVLAKLTASALVALALTAAYMIGLRSFMGAIAGDALAQANAAARTALVHLGLQLTPAGGFLIGLSLLFGILCALAIAMVLGMLADDVKSAPAATTPLTIVLLTAYLLPLFVDMDASPAALRWTLLAIPFTHAFLAPQNVMLGKFALVALGIAYQAAVFAVFVFVTTRLFAGEALLTLKFDMRAWLRGRRAGAPRPGEAS